MSAFAADFIDILIWVLTLAIFGRVLLSWISPRGNDPVTPLLYQVTEPILAPLRRLLPQMGMLDLAPMVAILVLNYLIRPLVLQLF